MFKHIQNRFYLSKIKVIVYNHKVHLMKIGEVNTRKLSNEKVYSERVLFLHIFFAIWNKE